MSTYAFYSHVPLRVTREGVEVLKSHLLAPSQTHYFLLLLTLTDLWPSLLLLYQLGPRIHTSYRSQLPQGPH